MIFWHCKKKFNQHCTVEHCTGMHKQSMKIRICSTALNALGLYGCLPICHLITRSIIVLYAVPTENLVEKLSQSAISSLKNFLKELAEYKYNAATRLKLLKQMIRPPLSFISTRRMLARVKDTMTAIRRKILTSLLYCLQK